MMLLLRLLLFLIVSLILLRGKTTKPLKCFSAQTWKGKDVLPLYLFFMVVPLLGFVLHKSAIRAHIYYFLWIGLSLVVAMGLVAWFYIIPIKREKQSIESIGMKLKDGYLLMVINSILLFLILGIIGYNEPSVFTYKTAIVMLTAFLVVSFWPVLEEVFYLGIMYIPLSRILGLLFGAVLVSLSSAFAHYHYDLENILMNSVVMAFGCFVYVKTRRLIWPIVMHSLLNSFVLLRDLNYIYF